MTRATAFSSLLPSFDVYPIKILGHLFANTGPLPQPFEACGADQTGDELDCESHVPCGE